MTINEILSENWKVFIATTIVAIILLGITLGWPYIQDRIWGKHSDPYICVFGMDNSYNLNQLKEQAPVRSKIQIIGIQFPKGVSSISNTQVPLKLFDWNYTENQKIYIITADNRGEGIAKNIKVDIDFTPNSIEFVKINHEDRVKIIQGGKPTGTRVVFKIDELLPEEVQDIEILITGKNIKSFNAWSESKGDIKNIYVMDIVIEPDKDFL